VFMSISVILVKGVVHGTSLCSYSLLNMTVLLLVVFI
jgi:hypothetical protein